MDWMAQNREKSQLGQILLGKKLISQQQLDEAIRAQAGSGRRLGEILADMRLITQAQVRGAIRRQRNLRLAAALATALLGPLQAYAAVASAPAAAVSSRAGWRPLSDAELGEVVAQGGSDEALREALNEQARQAELRTVALNAPAAQGMQAAAQQALPNDGVRVLGELAAVFNPLALLLSADKSVRDVVYDPANAAATVGKDGTVTLRLPSTIGEISFNNIRVGKAAGPSFGSVAIRDIDLRGTTISVKAGH